VISDRSPTGLAILREKIMLMRQEERLCPVPTVVRSAAENTWILRFAGDVIPLMPERKQSLPKRPALTEEGSQQAHVIKGKPVDMP
jgi:hypothetical protein